MDPRPPIFPNIPEAPFAAHHGALWWGMALLFSLKTHTTHTHTHTQADLLPFRYPVLSRLSLVYIWFISIRNLGQLVIVFFCGSRARKGRLNTALNHTMRTIAPCSSKRSRSCVSSFTAEVPKGRLKFGHFPVGPFRSEKCSWQW